MEKKFIVTDEAGLHARPATKVVNAASRYSSELTLKYKGREVNLKSIMGVMSLGIGQGSEIFINAKGEDEEEALVAIAHELRDQGICTGPDTNI